MNKHKKNKNNRVTWIGFHTRITPTKKGKLEKIDKKYKNKDYN